MTSFFLGGGSLLNRLSTFFKNCLMHQHRGNAPPGIQAHSNPDTSEVSVQKPHVTHSRAVNGFIGPSSDLTW